MALNFAENLIEDAWQLHQQIAEQLVLPTSKLMKTEVAMECISVERIQWPEFLNTLKAPLLLCLIDMPPLEGHFILRIQPSLALHVTAKLLNYTLSKDEIAAPRALTHIEKITLMQFVNLILTTFTAEWRQVYPQVEVQFKTIADSVAKLPSSYLKGTALLTDIELVMDGQAHGVLRFCYPPDLVDSIQKASAPLAKSTDQTSPSSESISPELITAIDDLLQIYTQRIEERLDGLEKKIDLLSKRRGWRR